MLKREKILIVDDDIMMRKIIKLMLEKLGYQVIVASSPDEAIDLFKKEKNSIDLLLTDVMMPGMNGNELKKRVEKIMPGIKTLFISGHTLKTISYYGVAGKGIHFLQKPFTLSNLAGKIKGVTGFKDN